jgi:MFS family permease
MMLLFPLYAVMFEDSGLNAFQISLLFIVWSATAFILEVPSGVFADKYSRKHILALGQLFKITGFVFWILMPNFVGFMIGFIFWGIKSALHSGTFEALIYDELKTFKKESLYTKVYGRLETAGNIAVITASIGASLLTPYGYQLIIAVSIGFIVLSWIPLYILPQIKSTESTHEKEYFSLLMQGLQFVKNSPVLIKLIVFLAIAIGIDAAIDEYYNPFARELGLPTQMLGYYFALVIFIDGIGSLIAYKFKERSNTFFYCWFVICGGILLGAALLGNYFSLALLILFTFNYRIIKLVFEGKVQDQIPTGVRATVSSVNGFAMQVCSIGMFFFFGLIVGDGEYQKGFIFVSLTMIVLGGLYWVQRLGRKQYIRMNS